MYNLLQFFITQSTQTDGQEVERARAWCDSMGTQYYRLTPDLSTVIDATEHEKEILIDMMYEGLHYTLRDMKRIDAVSRLLLTCTFNI